MEPSFKSDLKLNLKSNSIFPSWKNLLVKGKHKKVLGNFGDKTKKNGKGAFSETSHKMSHLHES